MTDLEFNDRQWREPVEHVPVPLTIVCAQHGPYLAERCWDDCCPRCEDAYYRAARSGPNDRGFPYTTRPDEDRT